MSEQTVHPHEPHDFTEVLFNGVRDITYQFDPEFGDTHHEVYWPPVVITGGPSDTEHFYEVVARDHAAEGRKLGLHGGLSFELSHLVTTHLAGEETEAYVIDHLPHGGERLALLPKELLVRIRSADGVLLFDYSRYMVSTFMPQLSAQHVRRLFTVRDGEEFIVMEDNLHQPQEVRGLTRFIPRARRSQEDANIHESNTHVLHILGQWGMAKSLRTPHTW